MTTQSDLATLNGYLATAASAASTWSKQAAAGTPYTWAEAATLIAIANAQKEAAAIGVDITPPPAPAPLTLGSVNTQTGTEGAPFAITLSASGGTKPYTFLTHTVPAGLTLNGSSGILSGTPTTSGTEGVVWGVEDAGNPEQTANGTFNIVVAPPVTPPPPPPVTGLVQGSYNGAANVAGNTAFGKEAGATMGLYSDYLAGNDWPTMVGTPGNPPWVIGQLKGKIPAGTEFVISVPLVTTGYANAQAALAAYAANPATLWTPYFTTFAQNMIADGFSNAIIRLMWEDDVFDYKSGDHTSATNYAKLWQLAHTAMMAVSGAQFKFAWYYAPSYDSVTLNDSYPGDAYVDYVTLDFYDQAWATGSGAPPYNGTAFTAAQENWLWQNSYLPGQLNGLAAFAKAHGKQIGFGEWGVITRGDNHGGGDSPTFITNFAAWVKTNNVAWISYFNFNDGGLNSTLSDFPNSLATYKVALG